MHFAGCIAMRHFLMNDARTGGHPLHITAAQTALIAQTVAMINRAFQHIGDGLDAAMRVPWKAVFILRRHIIAKIIHHQKRIEWCGIAKAKNAVQVNASALHCGA